MTKKSEVGELVRKARIEHNLSARELARLCNVSHTEINNIENGKRIRPSLFTLKSFEKYLGLNFRNLAKISGYTERTISDGARYFELYAFNKRSRKG